VFLISRTREQWRAGATNSDAVAGGLARTGRVITSAAAIMICVFAAFVLGDLRVLRVVGARHSGGGAAGRHPGPHGVHPAAFQLMGPANWWFPRRLERAIPDLLAETGTTVRSENQDISGTDGGFTAAADGLRPV
jgi:RND superfamily putative drug exporter